MKFIKIDQHTFLRDIPSTYILPKILNIAWPENISFTKYSAHQQWMTIGGIAHKVFRSPKLLQKTTYLRCTIKCNAPQTIFWFLGQHWNLVLILRTIHQAYINEDFYKIS